MLYYYCYGDGNQFVLTWKMSYKIKKLDAHKIMMVTEKSYFQINFHVLIVWKEKKIWATWKSQSPIPKKKKDIKNQCPCLRYMESFKGIFEKTSCKRQMSYHVKGLLISAKMIFVWYSLIYNYQNYCKLFNQKNSINFKEHGQIPDILK